MVKESRVSYKGTYTDLILNNFKPKKILMFEPQEEIFNFLKKKYSDNKDVYLFNKALSNENKSAKFNFNKHEYYI